MFQTVLLSIISSHDTVFTANGICHTESNKEIGIFWTQNVQLRFHEKRFDVGTDRWQWKIWKTVYKMISRNMRSQDEELLQAEQSSMDGPDL